jgi:hypothetical protein
MASAAVRETNELRSRGFTLSNPPLTPTENIALEALKQIASENRRATKAEICAAIGSDNYEGGTAPGVVNRLEDKGYVTTNRFQRGFQVCIVATGQCTALPTDTTPHWRLRTDSVPTPAIQSVRERSKPIAAMIEAEARLLGKSLSDFLGDLVYIGWSEYQVEKEAS